MNKDKYNKAVEKFGSFCSKTENMYDDVCNRLLLEQEIIERAETKANPKSNNYLYPTLNDANFNIKIANKKEFSDTKYDGEITDIKAKADALAKADFELSPHQAFVRNFMSFQTPYNSLLLYHGLGSGKTCSAIGVCEEMRDYLKQMGIQKKIIIVASPNVQDNFKLQLFDERKMKLVNDTWIVKGCLGMKLLKEINPTNLKGLKKERVVSQIRALINQWYSFVGYTQFSNEIVNVSGNDDNESVRIRKLQKEYNDSLIVIDEVHNVSPEITENKNLSKNLMYLVSVASNIRLLLLSATPMFNSSKEIIWLLNLMNMNDRRGTVSIKDIFDKEGYIKDRSSAELLIRKATGYISFVRGENPYIFPFRVYPGKDTFSYQNTFHDETEYPKYQMNGKEIKRNDIIDRLQIYISKIGDEQEIGYNYIIDRLRNKQKTSRVNKKDKEVQLIGFEDKESFGYTDLLLPLEALNIIYPLEGLKKPTSTIKDVAKSSTKIPELDLDSDNEVEDVDFEELFENGPEAEDVEVAKEMRAESESEPFVNPEEEPANRIVEGSVPKNTSILDASILEEEEFVPVRKLTSRKPVNIIEEEETVPVRKLTSRKPVNIIEEEEDEQIAPSSKSLSSFLRKATSSSPLIRVSSSSPLLKVSSSNNNISNNSNNSNNSNISGFDFDDISVNIDEPSSIASLEDEEEEFIIPKQKDLITVKKGPLIGSNIGINNLDVLSNETNKLSDDSIMNMGGAKVGGAKPKLKAPVILLEEDDDDIHISDTISIDSPNIKTQLVDESDNIDISNTISIVNDSDDDTSDNKGPLLVDAKLLTGVGGLERTMNYIDTKTPPVKGSFSYKDPDNRMFSPKEICKYSNKIKAICRAIYDEKTNRVSEGIILVYSAYIDGGLVPLALALEEMGLSRYGGKSLFAEPPTDPVDVRTFTPLGVEKGEKKSFMPATYTMITGDHRLSPNNDAEVKAITSENNLLGERIKVVLISQAGSEGLDFKAIRQIHIMEPWYNMNRIEQIIGRGVRNFSHKDLPFEKRNVQIFLHGTILNNNEEEAADLYVYRFAEKKSIKIGQVSRLLKQTAVDCLINAEQMDLTYDNLKDAQDIPVEQVLSTGEEIQDFKVGDVPYSSTCDYMGSCEYKCIPTEDENNGKIKMNFDTYNEAFMLVNSDKIIQKIKQLFRHRFFYKKQDLFGYINIPKKYPTAQVYAALTQMINDNSELLIDKYERSGYLINIGDYYLFQPSELNYKNISLYDRSVPLDYKHEMIKIDVKTRVPKPVVDKRNLIEFEIEGEVGEKMDNLAAKKLVERMIADYNVAREWFNKTTLKVDKADENWYKFCGIVMRKMNKEGIPVPVLEEFLIAHIIESLTYEDKLTLLQYISIDWDGDCSAIESTGDRFMYKVNTYFCNRAMKTKGMIGMLLFNGGSVADAQLFILKDNIWIPAEPEDKKDFEPVITNKYLFDREDLANYVGFLSFEPKGKYMIFKIKDTTKKRHIGSRCDQAGKIKTIKLLNEILGDEVFDKENTKGVVQQELCVRQEFILRNMDKEDVDGKIWFLDVETAVITNKE
jgi:hypothetical protein